MTNDPYSPLNRGQKPEALPSPSRAERRRLRALLLCGIGALAVFALWILRPEHRGDPLLDGLLLIAFLIMGINLLLEWRYYWSIKKPEPRTPQRTYTVDIFTTACPGEPHDMILRTLEAIQKVAYPNNAYLCDEGNDPELKSACERLGVTHLTRTSKKDAKAGNINNALRHSDGEICVILDPDHEPAPFLIDRVLGYFDDPDVGFVQSIQTYRNQHASFIARGAAQMQYHFYGPIQMGMHGAGTPQCIGANCVFRRSALDSIGGHAAGLAEDMHTTMRLYAKGWNGVYLPEVLTRGLVPQTLGAFYKQQLKWSKGTFDLLFRVYPRVFRSMNWARRLHFLICPAFFLKGWVTLFSSLVPVSCLFFGGIAWRIAPGPFLLALLPLLGLMLIIRARAQKFVLGPHERGFHLAGGILTIGSWWIFSLGNLCALFRYNIPYLPTPKESERADAWKLVLPNLVAAGVCLAAIPVGLHRDYSPFNVVMAGFAGWIAIALSITSAQAQQATGARIAGLFHRITGGARFFRPLPAAPVHLYRIAETTVFGICRRAPLTIAALLLATTFGAAMLSIRPTEQNFAMPWMHLAQDEKETGGFYSGIYLPHEIDEMNALPGAVNEAETKLGESLDITSLYLAWGPRSLDQFPEKPLRHIQESGGIPMITWEPWTSTFPWTHEQGHELAENKGILRAIANGTFDGYIGDFADRIQALDGPVFLRFGHEMDNPSQYPWASVSPENADTFVAAWRRIVGIFKQRGATNVAFVYNPWRSEALDPYYPGDEYVDWIGLTLLNYGKAGRDGKWHSFDALYQAFHHRLEKYDKPVMLAEFGTTAYGGNPAAWLESAFRTIKQKYPEIRAAVLFHTDRDPNIPPTDAPAPDTGNAIDWSVLHRPDAADALEQGFAQWDEPLRRAATPPAPDSGIEAAPAADWLKRRNGRTFLEIDGQPFYIRGVAYNPGHDWRDGNIVLSRRRLEQDLDRIKAMGANTIRRYSGGWADYNLFTIAAEKDLKILYGLWLDQDTDYLREKELLRELEADFVRLVEKHHDKEALLGWFIGNEVWSMFQYSYGQPYLTDVRRAYVRFVEKLAKRIKEIDPDRPVFVSTEFAKTLPGALRDYGELAPSVDGVGINVYYEEHFRCLPETLDEFAGTKAHLISEFGPPGYWHSEHSPRSPEGLLNEPSAREKADYYLNRWRNHIESRKESNLGGIAYCWSERYEGSKTWFGLVNQSGTPKPPYYALREVFTGDKDAAAIPGPVLRGLDLSDRRLAPGGKLVAEVAFDAAQPVTIEWEVVSANYRTMDAKIRRLSPDGEKVSIRLPSEPGRYWIHCKIQDPGNKMDEKALAVEVLRP